MEQKRNELVDPLLKSGNVFKLRCKNCKNISVQITQNDTPDSMCFECGKDCEVIK